MVIAAAVGAGAHRDHPAPLGHLVVDAAPRRRHLVHQCAGDDHHVGLARTRTEHHAEAVEVVTRGAGMHHFNGTAGEAEGHGPQRTCAGPIDELVGGGGHHAALEHALYSHSSAPFFHSKMKPTTRMARNTTMAMKPHR